MNESQVSVPLSVRLRFGHAAVQHLADEIGVDVLHIKGVAVDAELRPLTRRGSDVDVLVRPDHVARLDRALRQHGWPLYSTFEYGSPFGHAQTYLHDAWGYVDIHRYFPGIRVDARPRRSTECGPIGRRSPSPASDAPCRACPPRRCSSLLNAARSRADRQDVEVVWTHGGRRAPLGRSKPLVADLDAPVAFAAAVGELDRYRGERDYRLWKVVSEGGSRSEEWWARVRAAPTLGAAARVIARAPLVNVDHLAHRLGRQPTKPEIVAEFFARPARAVGEAGRALRRRGAQR